MNPLEAAIQHLVASRKKQPLPRSPEPEDPYTYYHQTNEWRAEEIRHNGFRRIARRSRRDGKSPKGGPIQGIFIKRTPDLLLHPSLGNVQLQVKLDPSVQLLDLRKELPMKRLAHLSSDVGSQFFAPPGWLERQGYTRLAVQYQEAIDDFLLHWGDNSPDLNKIWLKVERTFTECGFGGVQFIDRYPDGIRQKFDAVAVFDPKMITVLRANT